MKLCQSELLHCFPATGTGHWPLSMMDLSPNKRGCRSVWLSSSFVFSISFISFQYQRFSWEADLLDFHESYSRTSCRSPGICSTFTFTQFARLSLDLLDFHFHSIWLTFTFTFTFWICSTSIRVLLELVADLLEFVSIICKRLSEHKTFTFTSLSFSRELL